MNNWQIKKVSDIFDFIPTGSHSRADMTDVVTADSVSNIHYGDIHTKYSTYVNFERDKVPVLLRAAAYRNQMLLQDGDLIVADASEDYEGVGASVEVRGLKDKLAIAGLHTYAMRDRNDDTAPGFKALLFQDPIVHTRMMQVATYSKVFGVTKKSISDITLSLPGKPEQQRIVAVLEAWDEHLELLDRKIALKEQLKKGLMQQLLTGEKRLPGFSKEWRKQTIAKVAKINPSDDSIPDEFLYIDLELVKRGRLLRHPTNVVRIGAPSRAQRVLRKLDVLFQTVRPYQKNNYFFNLEGNYVASTGYTQLRAKDSAEFLYHFVQSGQFVKDVLRMCTGSSYPAITSTDLSKIKVYYPESDEQIAIERILSTLDVTVLNLKMKKEQAALQKKYLLKNLISGTIRTPENLQTKGIK